MSRVTGLCCWSIVKILNALNCALVLMTKDERLTFLIIERPEKNSLFNKGSITDGRKDPVEFDRCEVNIVLFALWIRSRWFRNAVSASAVRSYSIFQNRVASVECEPVFLTMLRARCTQQKRTLAVSP